ncbi:MAG: FtsW/RodA/SpoVE family cell cycle protein [Alphaproteobacteria bacterium]
MPRSFFFHNDDLRLTEKLRAVHWGLVLLVAMVCGIGVALLYSAGGRNWQPWAWPQMIRAGVGILLMLGFAMIDVRWWLRLAYPLYFTMLALLVVVEIIGHIGMGAQRWLNLGFFVIQPSEMMKITMILALARYFHGLPGEDIGRIRSLVPPALMAVFPIGMVLMQPNLGTAALLGFNAMALFFVAGVRKWKFFALFCRRRGQSTDRMAFSA